MPIDFRHKRRKMFIILGEPILAGEQSRYSGMQSIYRVIFFYQFQTIFFLDELHIVLF